MNADASALQSPLLQSVASERARRLVAEQEHASWRHSVSGALLLFHHLFGLLTVASIKFRLPVTAFARARVPRGRRRLSSWRKGDVTVLRGAEVLRCAAAAEAQPEHPAHIVGAWLGALLWLEDGRWRKLRSGGAPTEALEALLDALSRRTLLLSLPAAPDEDAQAGTPSSAAAAAQDELAPIWPVESNPSAKEVRSLSMCAGGSAVQDISCCLTGFKVVWIAQHGLAAAHVCHAVKPWLSSGGRF